MRTLAKLGLLEELVKAADITYEEHQKAVADAAQKQRELAALRGKRVRTVAAPQPTAEMYQGFLREEMRRAKAMGDTAHYESLKAELANPAQQFSPAAQVKPKRVIDPNFRMSGKAPGATPLREAETIKAHIPGADSAMMRAKHQWLGPAKRFFGTPMGKALGIGALGATGLGLYSYLSNRKTPQPEQYQLSPQEQSMMQQQMYGAYPKMGSVMNAANVPAPPTPPRVSAPGPAIGSLPTIERKTPGDLGLKPGTPGKDAVKEEKEKKADLDPSIAALLGGGVGGGLGYLAGEHLVNPLIKGKETEILKEIAERQKSLGNWQTLRKYTPIGIAALGAVALASVAAAKARSDERAKMQTQNGLAGHLVPYDPTGAGFGAADRVPIGSPYENVY